MTGPPAPAKRDWLLVLILIALSYSISTGVRLLEATKWQGSEFRAGGEPILASHDAYAWLPGGQEPDRPNPTPPMVGLSDAAAAVLRVSPAEVAFWAPAFLSSLVAVPLVLWAKLLGSTHVSVLVGVLGSLFPAYLTRTRLGFFDTDWAVVLFPLLFGVSVARAFRPHLRRVHSNPSSVAGDFSVRWLTGAILVLAVGLPWHGFIGAYATACIWLAAGLSRLLARGGHRPAIHWQTIALGLPILWGWFGAILAVALVLLLHSRPGLLTRTGAHRISSLLAAFLLIALVFAPSQRRLLQSLAAYAGIQRTEDTPIGEGVGIEFPNAPSAVAELQDVSLSTALAGMAFSPGLGIVGVVSFIYIAARRPHTILLAPMLVAGIGSTELGRRFAILGGPVLLLAAIVSIEWLIRRWRRPENGFSAPFLGLSLIAALASAVVIYGEVRRLPATPALEREHAEALIALADLAAGEGFMWTWWDYGYATRYFTGLEVFADGGRNTGEYVFVLGSVLSAADPELARKLILFSAANDHRPWEWMQRHGRVAFEEVVRNGSVPERDGQTDSPQYLVVSWELLRALPWIAYYGAWDFTSKSSELGRVTHLEGAPVIDAQNGLIEVNGGKPIALSTIDLLGRQRSEHREFSRARVHPHLMVDLATNRAILLDDFTYSSLAVQLLISPPEEFTAAQPFQLVIDRAPHARVLRVRQLGNQ